MVEKLAELKSDVSPAHAKIDASKEDGNAQFVSSPLNGLEVVNKKEYEYLELTEQPQLEYFINFNIYYKKINVLKIESGPK